MKEEEARLELSTWPRQMSSPKVAALVTMHPKAERGTEEVGNPEFTHTQISPLPVVWRGQ